MSKNIKEIGKELLGKSLNSFHRKTGLTQLEKNNEMQDGILDGILSQVDDAYIEKTEQSNVIHLDGSGDGVVVLDSIEGNTMVNCINRIPFNTTPTTTPNTVYCNNDGYITVNAKEGTYTNAFISKDYCNLKPNTKYTLIIEVVENTLSGGFLVGEEYRSDICTRFDFRLSAKQTGIFKIVSTTKDGEDFTNGQYALRSFAFNTNNLDGEKIKYRIFILEGDYSNIEVNYFEGLQSSFEEKVNNEGKYEIEILLNNKNLIDNSKSYQSSYASWIPNIDSLNKVVKTDTYNATFNNRGVGFLVKDLKPNTQYTLSIPSLLTNNKLGYALYDNENSINNWDYHIQGQGNISTNKITFTTPNRKTVAVVGVYGSYDVLYNNGANDGTVTIGNYRNLQLEIGNKNTEFNLQKQNKIKLLINEPLRSTPHNISDRLCIKDKRLVVERKCGEITLDGSEDWSEDQCFETFGQVRIGHIGFDRKNKPRNKLYSTHYTQCKIYSDNMKNAPKLTNISTENLDTVFAGDSEYYALFVKFKNSTLGLNDGVNVANFISKVKEYLRNKNVTVVYELEEPYYEEVLNEYGEPIVLEGYENGTVYIDSTIVPTTTVRYTPKMESFKTLKEVNKNNNLITLDINDNIIPYMMDVDLMIMEKELCLLNTKNIRKMEVLDMTSMQKRTQDMLERLIKGKTLTEQECKTRVTTYLNAGKIIDEQAEELNFLIDEIYA